MASDYKLTVGMEVHVELETKTKMFCGCKNDPFHSEPNTNVCPVCYGLPGALPLLNKEAVAMVIRFGRAIKAETATKTFWARKNYFYPDLPKGYQISQSTMPLVVGGQITLDGTTYHLDHAHLEEDAGKLKHWKQITPLQKTDGKIVTGTLSEERVDDSLVDLNRAGVPLLEIVTEPDFHTAEAAKKFCQELQRIFRTLKVSTADLEKGQMRCEANISVSKTDELGTKIEVKNIGSFRSVERAIQYEFDRQTKALESGEKLHQETRGWDDVKGETYQMRSKETSADYRYFPEPDLPMVAIDIAEAESTELLPDEQRAQLAELGLHKEVIGAVVDKHGFGLVIKLAGQDRELALEAGKLFLAIPALADLNSDNQISLIELRKRNGWSKETTEEIITKSLSDSKTIEELVPDFTHNSDINAEITAVIEKNPGPVSEYKAGKGVVFQFLVGQVMAATKGRANIQQVRDELKKALD